MIVRVLFRACSSIKTSEYVSFAKSRNTKVRNMAMCMPSKRLHDDTEKTRGFNGNRQKYAGICCALPSLFMLGALLQHEENIEAKEYNDIQALLQKGQQMLRTKHKLQEVEKVYTEALHLALERDDNAVIAQVQSQLADLALDMNEIKKAETLFLNAIKNLLASGLKENDPAVLEISLKLVTIYATYDKKDVAITGYEWIIQKCRENLKKGTEVGVSEYNNQLALLGMTLDSYGRYLFSLEMTKKSLDVTREAADISSKLFGDSDIRTLVLLNDIGAALTYLGNLEEASKLIETVVKNAIAAKNVQHSDVAIFLVNLGSIYKKQNNEKKASKAFKKAKKEAAFANDKNLLKQIEHFIAEFAE